MSLPGERTVKSRGGRHGSGMCGLPGRPASPVRPQTGRLCRYAWPGFCVAGRACAWASGNLTCAAFRCARLVSSL
jgi:hypothetical protein